MVFFAVAGVFAGGLLRRGRTRRRGLRVVAFAAAGGLMAEIVLAALVSASAAVANALVAVFIVFMAVFIA